MFGMVCLQVSAIPSIIQAYQTGEAAPLANIILLIIGLIACCIQELQAKLYAYLIGSLIGIVGNVGILIALYLR